MADAATQHAHRSLGCRASRPVVEGWEVAEVTQLWLAGAQRPASNDFTHPSSAAALWSHNERALARQRWSRECERTMGTNYNEPEGCRESVWQQNKKGKNKSDWCVEIEKGEAVSTGQRQWARKPYFYLPASQWSPFWGLIISSWPEGKWPQMIKKIIVGKETARYLVLQFCIDKQLWGKFVHILACVLCVYLKY